MVVLVKAFVRHQWRESIVNKAQHWATAMMEARTKVLRFVLGYQCSQFDTSTSRRLFGKQHEWCWTLALVGSALVDRNTRTCSPNRSNASRRVCHYNFSWRTLISVVVTVALNSIYTSFKVFCCLKGDPNHPSHKYKCTWELIHRKPTENMY